MNCDPTWAGKTALITGHTGFKGGWLTLALKTLGARVLGYSLAPLSNDSFYSMADVGRAIDQEIIADIRDLDTLSKFIQSGAPEFIFHLAAQPIVITASQNPHETIDVNITGTSAVLNCLSILPRCICVVVTSDKSYLPNSNGKPFKEEDILGGNEPYSASKACAEMITSSYRQLYQAKGYNFRIGTARCGNVIGGGDYGEHRIIPDIVRAIKSGTELRVRMPSAVRPWLHVLDSVGGYIKLAEKLNKEEDHQHGWNFGPIEVEAASVENVVRSFQTRFPELNVVYDEVQNILETKLLRLDPSNAIKKLGWLPKFDFEGAISNTIEWYRSAEISVEKIPEISRVMVEKYFTHD
jgi:CDP-glucose 4,6-dehydratase